jgi:hypothetical protein
MSDIALLIFLAYIGYLVHLGFTGGTDALKMHLFSLWFILIVSGVVAQIYFMFNPLSF